MHWINREALNRVYLKPFVFDEVVLIFIENLSQMQIKLITLLLHCPQAHFYNFYNFYDFLINVDFSELPNFRSSLFFLAVLEAGPHF